MNISFLDLKKQYRQIKKEVLQAIEEVCANTAFSGGPWVERFEKNFAAYCGTDFCVAVNSGTSALHLAMVLLGIGPGDEVILPANTFIATAWAVSYVNARPVFVDCSPHTWNISPEEAEKKITEKTKAIIGVHLYGQPFDIDALEKIAKEHNLYLVEDCAQAHGARYRGERVGVRGEAGCFSFYPGKNLGAYGEGGALVTSSKNYAEELRSLRNHGSKERYYHERTGFNMRMDGFQGAVLDIKLKYLDAWNGRRKEIAKMYHEGIKNPAVKMQYHPEWADSVYHLFVITVPEREKFMEYLKSENIFAGLHYPVPCHLQKAYSYLGYKKGDLPGSEYLADHCLSLPMYAELSDEEVFKVIEVINKF